MLGAVQTQWLDTCEYFTRVQCAGTEEEERGLARELPTVKKNLDAILDALLLEKRHLESIRHAAQLHREETNHRSYRQQSIASFASSVLYGTPAASPDRATHSRSAADISPSSAMWSFTETTSTTVPSTPHAAADHHGSPTAGLSDALLRARWELPPCYHYLFAPPPSSSTSTSSKATPYEGEGGLSPSLPPPRSERAAGTAALNANEEEEEEEDSHNNAGAVPFGPATDISSVFPTTIGSTFLLTLCMYAKHNQPAGSRTIILEFLQDLILRADLPTTTMMGSRHGRRRTGAAADLSRSDGTAPPRSILQLSLSSSIVPLLDMIRKVGVELDPSHPSSSGGGTKRAALGRSVRLESGTAQENVCSDADRTAFVRFLCALAERIEQVPDLANYFVTAPPSSLAAGGTSSSSSAKQEADHFVLLEILLPYMTHDCTAAGWEQRRDTCRFALSAVLSLAKCPDTWVQDLVAKKVAIADRTLAAACTTLLTLCKIPDNDDSEVQLLYLRDVMRFWSALCLSAPAVADGLGIAEAVENDFARTALGSLFASPDSRVYSAACLVASALLADLNASAPVVPAAIARALLSGVVDMDTGRRHRHGKASDYYDLVLRRRRHCSNTSRSGDAADGDARLGSFFEYYIVGRLSTQPTLTEEDLASKSVLGVVVSEWTAVEATLVLLKSMVENCPYLLAKYAFLADMDDLSTQTTRSAGVPLSASHSAPRIDVGELFPARLQAADGSARKGGIYGDSSEQLSEEVLQCMLRIESNVPTGALHELQRAVMTLAPDAGSAPQQATAAGSGDASSDTQTKKQNAWYYAPIAQEAPLTRALCELLSDFTSLPFRSSILLTQLCVRVCLLSDLRIVYTLLDPTRGPMTQALQHLRKRIDFEMDEDEKFAVASAAAAAATAVSSSSASLTTAPFTPKRIAPDGDAAAKEGRRSRSRGSFARAPDESAVAELPPTSLTRAYLFELYLAHWQHLPTHLLSSLEDERDTRGLERIASPSITAPSVVGAPGTISNDAVKALIRHQPFLESCACLEQFRMELDAAVGYMTLSHKLMSLKV